jgi:hypothetical protein
MLLFVGVCSLFNQSLIIPKARQYIRHFQCRYLVRFLLLAENNRYDVYACRLENDKRTNTFYGD